MDNRGAYVCGVKLIKMNDLKKIVFKKTANPFYNAGIIGFHRIASQYLREHAGEYSGVRIDQIIGNEFLLKYSEEEVLLPFLEEVYYYMGRIYYDTVTDKQKSDPKNIYFVVDGDKLNYYLFPRMKTYGLSYLFTNDAQGVTRLDVNSQKLETLKKNNPDLAFKVENTFKSKGIKIGKKIYFNEPYTKLTRLVLNSKHLVGGGEFCPITGEKYKFLVEAKNISPFLSGLSNFNSFLSSSERKISWKALYIIRFAPVVCFYSYHNNYENFVGHLFEAGSLEALNDSYIPSLYHPKEVLSQNKQNYRINFDLGSFSYSKKDGDNYNVDISSDAKWTSELTFTLIYRFFSLFFRDKITEETQESVLFSDEILQKIPLTLITFEANKFASTIRPSSYVEYDQLVFIFRLLYQLETSNLDSPIQIRDIWRDLKFTNSRIQAYRSRDYEKGMKLERQHRANIFDAILKKNSILHHYEKFYFDIYNAYFEEMTSVHRKYKSLFNFFKLYQKLVPMNLSHEMQEYAIKMGISIGQGIIHFDTSNTGESDVKTNIKAGRKYIIDLRNARTLDQFLKAIERIMFKYQINIRREILEGVNVQNFVLVKQFAVISALNQINPILSPFSLKK